MIPRSHDIDLQARRGLAKANDVLIAHSGGEIPSVKVPVRRMYLSTGPGLLWVRVTLEFFSN